eukprot:GHVL01040237.1.p1 GENE.GHVL01040237.1~~GHVL01040237.1.p1  ORF type:complete len:325 (+),score=84.97 GHVL01040237.1:726-1700(+)
MKPFYQRLCKIANTNICHVYPNAGLPNAMGGYDEDPSTFASNMEEFAKEGLINICGGCCGTTPHHIKELVDRLKNIPPRIVDDLVETPDMLLSGLEHFLVSSDKGFVNIGERCNISGSIRFKKLILAGNYSEALEVARQQVENGAQIVDFNFDEAMIDGKEMMGRFCRMVATDPDICKVPFMLDSSKFDVSIEGCKWIQGKSIINSISLKNGEYKFIEDAKLVKKFGAAVVVMAFDENGQAADKKSKIDICIRAYNLLKSISFPREDIIFDVNILTIATGIVEHDNYAVDFMDAVEELKILCPKAKFSVLVQVDFQIYLFLFEE